MDDGGKPEKNECYVRQAHGMTLLSRKLPSGRVINVDTMDGEMLRGGSGIAHLNMDNGDNRIVNLKYVTEAEARSLLLAFEDRRDPSRSPNALEPKPKVKPKKQPQRPKKK